MCKWFESIIWCRGASKWLGLCFSISFGLSGQLYYFFTYIIEKMAIDNSHLTFPLHSQRRHWSSFHSPQRRFHWSSFGHRSVHELQLRPWSWCVLIEHAWFKWYWAWSQSCPNDIGWGGRMCRFPTGEKNHRNYSRCLHYMKKVRLNCDEMEWQNNFMKEMSLFWNYIFIVCWFGSGKK